MKKFRPSSKNNLAEMLKHLLVLLCATTVVLCRPTARNVLAAVRSLSDDELTALEIALGLPTATDDIDENAVDDDEEMQGDQPQPGGNETALDPIKSRSVNFELCLISIKNL